MSSSFKEFEGKNVDLAVQIACDELKISNKKLSYDIISKGSSGIFGFLGKKNAKIKVILPRGYKNYKKKNGNKSSGGAISLVDEAFGTSKKSF